MAPSEITPFILAYNEEPNIARCLESLTWASQILVLDSCSTDRTAEIVARFPQARFVQRPFDCHSAQANFGLGLIQTSWVLSMDADYVVTPELQRAMLQGEIPFDPACVYFTPFRFLVFGCPMRTAFMPPRGVLYAHRGAAYAQDGHTQRIILGARRPVMLRQEMIHDDRKPLKRWLDSQGKYAALEAEKLRATPLDGMPMQDRLRRTGWIAPLVILPYALFKEGLIWKGWPGFFYALQRLYAELVLALHILDHRFRDGKVS